jgi:hypothetical protein
MKLLNSPLKVKVNQMRVKTRRARMTKKSKIPLKYNLKLVKMPLKKKKSKYQLKSLSLLK